MTGDKIVLASQTDLIDKQVELQNEFNSKINAIAPNSGYTRVSKKLDNFVFQESSSFLNKVSDKNRYVKFGDKVVDTYGPELVDNGDFSSGVLFPAFNYTEEDFWSVVEGKAYHPYTADYKALEVDIPLSVGTFVLKWDIDIISGGTAKTNGYPTSGLVYDDSLSESINCINGTNRHILNVTNAGILVLRFARSSAVEFTVDNISVREIQTAQFQVPEVTEIITEVGGVTTKVVNKGQYVIVEKTDPTDHTGTVFRSLVDNIPIGTSVVAGANFEDRTQIGVTNQSLAYHAYNTLTNAYEGIKTEVLFSDVSKDDLLDNPTWLARNGFSKVSQYLYSKGSYLCLPVGIWQS